VKPPAGAPHRTAVYADSLTVGHARDVYFADNGFSLAGYTDRWVKLKLGPIPIAFPNTAARKAAVKLHDLHHVATGYQTTWTGEAEIGAWEIGASCGRYWAAWFLNLGALGVGMWTAPRRVLRAFARGRRSNSLYHRAFGDDLLALTVGDLRTRLGLDAPPPAITARDVVGLLGWLCVSKLIAVLALAPIVVAIWLFAR
jgi:hypothetical protein